jgi:hypothetical protein
MKSVNIKFYKRQGNYARQSSACDRLCGLVFRVPGYTSSGPGSIPGATICSEK